eukprot:4776041-Amphidinium_carterae.1
MQRKRTEAPKDIDSGTRTLVAACTSFKEHSKRQNAAATESRAMCTPPSLAIRACSCEQHWNVRQRGRTIKLWSKGHKRRQKYAPEGGRSKAQPFVMSCALLKLAASTHSIDTAHVPAMPWLFWPPATKASAKRNQHQAHTSQQATYHTFFLESVECGGFANRAPAIIQL